MKEYLLDFLECPVCNHAYHLDAGERDGAEVMTGTLACTCGSFLIRNGVPRLMPQTPDARNWETAARFGEEWSQFSMLTDQYEEQFLSWIEPVTRDHFRGKLVLDAGCGKGRHVLHANPFGARDVVGV